MRLAFVFIIFALVALTNASFSPDGPYFGLFCADNGTFSGSHELKYIIEALTNVQVVTTLNHCQSASTGMLMTNGGNMPVLVITTGINELSSGLCTEQVVFSNYILSSAIFVGTSGWSPFLSGGFNPTVPGGCNKVDAGVSKLSLGSVCITSSSFDFGCGECVDHPFATECSRPDCTLHDTQSLFGPCSFTGDVSLASALVAKAHATRLPNMGATLAKLSQDWWNANQAAEGASDGPKVPTILSPSQCAESAQHSIWTGPRNDYLCREYTAKLVSASSPSDVSCVSAMEGPGFIRSLKLFPGGNIPFAIVRGASNYDMYPLSALSNNGWAQNATYTPAESHQKFVKEGFRFAVQTTNTVVLAYLKSLTST